jgi:hypothetical protein
MQRALPLFDVHLCRFEPHMGNPDLKFHVVRLRG